MIPLNYQSDRRNMTLKKKSSIKHFRLFCRYEIYCPSKCPVYVRLPWIGSPSQLIDDKISSSVTHCYNAAMVWTIFTTRAEFRSIHKDVLPIFQQSNLIYKLHSCCNTTYIGCTSRCLEVIVKQHVPRGCPRGVMVKAMDCGIVVREIELQSRYYVHFRANTLGKGMNPLILTAMC